MGLEAGTYVNDLVTANPISNDKKGQGDDHLRLLKTVLRNTFPRAAKAFPFYTVLTKTADYTVLSTDEHTFFKGDGTAAAVNFTLPALASGDAGWFAEFRAINLTNAVTLTPASGQINGAASYSLQFVGHSALAWWDGTNWWVSASDSINIAGLGSLTLAAKDDSAVIYDLSATTNKKISILNLFRSITSLDAMADPAALADGLLLYDASADAAVAITPALLLAVINALTEDATPDLDADFVLSYDTSASGVKKIKPRNIAPFSSQLLHIQDQRAAGTAGGSMTSGAWNPRTIQTAITNEIAGASLAANQITLPAGTYFLEAYGFLMNSGGLSQHRIQNITDATTLLTGLQEEHANGGGVFSSAMCPVSGRFTLAGTKTLEFQYRTTAGLATNGLGAQINWGTEVYADVKIWKL